MGCYSFIESSDEIRLYPRDTRLDNSFMKSLKISAPLLLLNMLRDKLVTFGADSQITIYSLLIKDNDYVNCKCDFKNSLIIYVYELIIIMALLDVWFNFTYNRIHFK